MEPAAARNPGPSVTCSSCQSVLKLPAAFTPGATARCPKCRTPVTLPVSSPQQPTQSALVGEGFRNEPTEDPEAAPVDESSFLEAPKAAGELGWLGPYRILGKLGEGGMGMVYVAEDTKLRRKVALKVMLPKHAANPTAKARFLREARAQAAVEHENVAAIFVVGDDQAVPYIAMPLLKGQTLQAALKASPRPPVNEVLRIGREMAEGLAAAHACGLIHRDIKPANIWLEGSKRKVKILDFGLARTTSEAAVGEDPTLTGQGMVVGTPAYMSPEQASGKPLDGRTDLFSLGVLLYEMATGTRPFKGGSTMEILFNLASERPAAPREVNPNVPPALSDLILRLLEKDPVNRPANAQQVAEELERIDMPTVVAISSGTQATNNPWAEIDVTDTNVARQAPERTIATEAAPVRSSSKKRLWIGLGGLFAAVLLGVIIIKITNKDGSVTELKAPDGSKVEVVNKGKTTVVVDPNPKKDPIAKVEPKVEPPKTPTPPDNATITALEASAKKWQAEWAAKLKLPVEDTNKLGMKLMLIPPGARAVGVAKPFLMGKYEVTQAEWEKVMGYNPSNFNGPNLPVEQVNWFDCIEFCNKLSEFEGLKPYYELTVEERTGKSIKRAEVKILGGNGYKLPSDAEWTWGCAAGAKTKYHFGDSDTDLLEYAWFNQNAGGRTHNVGEKKPNAFGLYDIHGNVREWNEEILTKTDGASERVNRGGNWNNTAGNCAVSNRNRNTPANRNNNIGLRVAQASHSAWIRRARNRPLFPFPVLASRDEISPQAVRCW